MSKFFPIILAFAAIALTGCTQAPAATTQQQQPQRPRIALKRSDVTTLGKRIWQNECRGSKEGLVWWNDGEAFPSMGIAHFLWFPKGVRAPFHESFPSFIHFARSMGAQVPAFFNGPAPWRNKSAFLADRSGKADMMRDWLARNIELQARFIIARSFRSLPTMMKASRNPAALRARYYALAATPQGMYCLVDYVNFKGEGIQDVELYGGHGWGLRQVLEEMRGFPQGRAATAEFSRAAAAVLRRRVANAPASRRAREQKWLPGWLNRCATYR